MQDYKKVAQKPLKQQNIAKFKIYDEDKSKNKKNKIKDYQDHNIEELIMFDEILD